MLVDVFYVGDEAFMVENTIIKDMFYLLRCCPVTIKLLVIFYIFFPLFCERTQRRICLFYLLQCPQMALIPIFFYLLTHTIHNHWSTPLKHQFHRFLLFYSNNYYSKITYLSLISGTQFDNAYQRSENYDLGW